uniref:Uncharacterized protein n=1 Tax=Nothoprocta perdicaria TaxID=30464 RepID=A0A8C7EDM7_NOTPE
CWWGSRCFWSPAAMAGDERDYNLTEEQKAIKAKYPPVKKKYDGCFFPPHPFSPNVLLKIIIAAFPHPWNGF